MLVLNKLTDHLRLLVDDLLRVDRLLDVLLPLLLLLLGCELSLLNLLLLNGLVDAWESDRDVVACLNL